MFKRVLVPLQGAGADAGAAREERAVEVARQLAEHEGARLVLLHVDRVHAGHAAHAQIVSHAAIITRAAELRRAGAQVSVHFASGAIGDGIAQAAYEEHADLIVIAPHRRSLLRTLLQPGITGQLMRRAPTPLLIWPERRAGAPRANDAAALEAALTTGVAGPVIVPLDGSREAERALPLAEAFAQEHQRTLLLVIVAAQLPLVGLDMYYPGVALPTGAELPEDRLREGLRYVGHLRTEILARTSDLAVQTAGRIGDPAPIVAELAASHPGSVVVMTTHERGRALRLLLGSVASELLSLTPVPLLIVPSHRRTSGRVGDAHVRLEAVDGEESADGEEAVTAPAGGGLGLPNT